MSHYDYGRPTEAQLLAYRFDLAETKRMQRTQDEAEALMRRLARQRIRFILNRLMTCLMLTVSLSGCAGCIYGRDYVVFGTNEHRCLDP